jgi:hypothetical protein
MQNSTQEDFKKKYLKYKAKYLELKDLLEGGIPPKKGPTYWCEANLDDKVEKMTEAYCVINDRCVWKNNKCKVKKKGK